MDENLQYAPLWLKRSAPNTGVKECSACGIAKPLTEFHKQKGGAFGCKTRCKPCIRAYHRTHEGIKKSRFRNAVKYNYNITFEQYEEMHKRQNGCCAICKVPESQLKKRLAIDHCHKTGTVRGLLCERCNIGLGLFKDSIGFLESAINYLSCNDQSPNKA